MIVAYCMALLTLNVSGNEPGQKKKKEEARCIVVSRAIRKNGFLTHVRQG